MERGLTSTYMATSQSTSPLCFSNRFIHRQFLLPIIISSDGKASITSKTRKSIFVKAFNSGTRRHTLSSNWNFSNFSSFASSAPTMPRFEELDTTNMILRQRIIFLGSQVDDVTANFIISQLLFLDVEDPTKDIKLFINSPGGSVTAGMGIYDAMKMRKADVSTICLGLLHQWEHFFLLPVAKARGSACLMGE